MRLALLLLFLISSLCHHAQISGTVTDEAGDPLPFVSVYVANTSRGVTTNIEGDYLLKVAPGDYELIFQYVGYTAEKRSVSVPSTVARLDVQLSPESIALSTFEVSADGEDPAYAVMRKAIAKREHFRDRLGAYAVDVYIKGQVKLKDVPDRLFGQELGDLDGNIDSTRQGIVYLSESLSRLYVQPPGGRKEVMRSSKVSGNTTGFSFNSASSMNYSLYEERVDFQRKILSPLADNAFQYYRFRLEGTTYNDAGKLVNKIELLPKRSEDPVFHGYLYIVEDDWNIDRIDVYLLQAAMRVQAIDTLYIQQLFVPGPEPDMHLMFSQRYAFTGKLLMLGIGGQFAAVYTDYEIDPELPERFFDDEIFKVETGANERSAAYWDTLRPLPLTIEETTDYRRKDSIELVRGTRAYQDSTDRETNKFTPLKLVTGYTYRNSYRRWSMSYDSPLSAFQFDPVRGYSATIQFRYRQFFDEQESKRLLVSPRLSYGLSEKRLRAAVSASYRLNRIRYTTVYLDAGGQVRAFHPNAISATLATQYALFNTRNFRRLYDRSRYGAGIQHFVSPGWRFYAGADWERREALFNTTDSKLFGPKRRAYLPNNPPPLGAEGFETHRGVIARFTLVYQPGQKYITYPDRRFLPSSPWPRFIARYRGGVGTDEVFEHFSALSLEIRKRNIPLGLFGNFSFRAQAEHFLQAPPANQFMDYHHFTGNQTRFYNPSDDALRRFQLLDYYSFSTREDWVELHVEHNFNGYILDKLPLLRKLNFNLLLAGRYAASGDFRYQEVSVGLGNVGIGPFRNMRIDYVWSFGRGRPIDNGYRIGIAL